jgi:D-amino-acid oxidase
MHQGNSGVTVIGAGVIGLTTAIVLAEADVPVSLHAAELPLQTTSVAAGAVWGAHLVGADDRVPVWAATTLEVLRELTASPFVHVAEGMTAVRDADAEPPDFAAAGSLSACPAGEVPPGYKAAWRLSAPLVAMPDYLEYLYERYLRAGGAPVVQATYQTLADAASAGGTRVLVNCAGAGAHGLVPDTTLSPVRGQAVVVRNPGIAGFFVGTGPDQDDLTYFFPHGDRVVLGGTEQPGNWSREPDPTTAERIVAACAAIEPSLGSAPVIAHRVGLRPFRPHVRLEAQALPDETTVVHNYGHGGSGVTLAWGCAQDAAALALAALAR